MLIDAGWGTPESLAALDGLLRRIGSSADDVRRVLVTHFHPDHCGSAGAFQRQRAVEIGMHDADARHLDHRFFHRAPFEAETVRWLRAAGAPGDVIDAGLQIVAKAAAMVAELAPDHIIQDGELIKHGVWELVALHTPGHTPGHLCFYERTTRTMFSGDHVLSFINTSPGLRPQSTADPVGDYLGSFDRLRELDVDLVLPGHQEPFTGFATRLESLRQHHLERMSATRRLLAEGCHTVWDVTSRISRSRAWEQLHHSTKISAMGETFGHLVYLAVRGQVLRANGSPDHWESV
jgi:glyoxylase-like metal-dependent hydrolase (beta-lactamase superfamily II)